MGFSYTNGLGCERNESKAVELYERSAHSGNSGAMYNLGRGYEYGYGVTIDLNKAREWYTKALAQSDEGEHKHSLIRAAVETQAAVEAQAATEAQAAGTQ